MIIILIIAVFNSITGFAENYDDGNYEDFPTLTKQPHFCLVNFEETSYPYVKDYLFFQTENAIKQWNDAIEMYYWIDWTDFEFETVNGYDILSDCNIYVYYIDIDTENIAGKAMLWGDTGLIYIYYNDPDTQSIRAYVDYTIKHEIGHVFGLGHRPSSMSSLSVMTPSNEDHKDYDQNWINVIDAYSVYKIYGGNGFSDIVDD